MKSVAMPDSSLTNAQWNNGAWRYFEANLTAALRIGTGLGGASLSGSGVVGVELEGHSLDVDDLTLSGGFCRRSYEMIPGAAIGGVLGSWTGANVAAMAAIAFAGDPLLRSK